MNKLPIWEARDFLSLRGWHFQSRARSHKKYIQSVKILSRVRAAGKKRQPALVVMSSPFFITRRVRLYALSIGEWEMHFLSHFFYPCAGSVLYGERGFGVICVLCAQHTTTKQNSRKSSLSMGWAYTPIVKTHSAKLVWKFNFLSTHARACKTK